MAKGRQAMFVRHNFIVNLKELSMAERGRLFTAMLEYSIDGKTPELGGNERFIWPAAKLMIDDDTVAYQKIVEQRQAAARERWSTDAGACESMRLDARACEDMREMQYINTTPTININTNSYKETLSKEREKKRFVPPSLDEVTAYCAERNNTVDPEGFIAFYTSNGWKVGKNPMKDWKAAVRSWEQRDRKEAIKQAKKKKPGRFDVLNEAIRKEMAANGSGGGNAMSFLNGKPLVELPGAGDS